MRIQHHTWVEGHWARTQTSSGVARTRGDCLAEEWADSSAVFAHPCVQAPVGASRDPHRTTGGVPNHVTDGCIPAH